MIFSAFNEEEVFLWHRVYIELAGQFSTHAVGLDISPEERLVCEKNFQPIGSIEGKKESRRQDRRGGGECTHTGTQRIHRAELTFMPVC